MKRMYVIKYFLLIIFLFQVQQSAFGQVAVFEKEHIPKDVPQSMDIYLVIGQSNMAGRAEIKKEDTAILEHAYLFTGNSSTPWVHARNPLNRYATTRKGIEMQRLSPAYSFTKVMIAHSSKEEIGLVMNAKGGTKIMQWLPGANLYEEAVKQTHKALEYGILKGIIWHQGESDSDPIRTELYLERIEILINALREEFNSPKLPFVAGQIFESEKRNSFNKMILKLPSFIDYTGVVSSKGVKTFDGTHFDSDSALMMGKRYAAEMKKIQDKLKK